MSANDENGQLRVRAQQYGRGTINFDYAPGPLQQDGTGYPNCGDWDRFFLITRGQVDTLMALTQAGEPIDLSRIPENVLALPMEDPGGIEMYLLRVRRYAETRGSGKGLQHCGALRRNG